MLHGQLIQIQAGYGGRLMLPGRRLPRHAGHPQDGKSGGRIVFFLIFVLKDFAYRQ